MKRSMTLALAGAAALAALAYAPAAAADTPNQRVSYAAFDLNADAGARATLDRIRTAAANVCGDRSGPMPLAERAAIRRCAERQTEEGVQELAHPRVTALFRGGRVIVAQN